MTTRFWKHWQPPSFPSIFTWEYGLASLLLAIVFSRGLASLYEGYFPQNYPQLVVGDITWDVGAKNPDYLILFGFVVLFFVFHTGLRSLAAAIYRVNGSEAELGLRELLAYALLPAAVWIGHIFVTNRPTLDLVILSTVLLVFVVIFAGVIRAKKIQIDASNVYVACLGSSVITLLFAALSAISLMLAISRLDLSWKLDDTQAIYTIATMVVGFGIWLIYLWGKHRITLELLQTRLRLILGVSQCFLPLSFLVLIPSPWSDGQTRFYGYALTPALYGFIFLLIVASYGDTVRRLLQENRQPTSNFIFSVLSPLCLIAILVYVKAPIVGASFVSSDDYHSSEALLPWWLFKTFHYLPYVDYDAARGLVNYVSGALASLFFNDHAGSYNAVLAAPQALLYLTISFPILARMIGALPAFFVLILFPTPCDNVYEIDLIVTVGICILVEIFSKHHPLRWLVSWLAISLALILFAPGQGGLFTISTFPLALIMGYYAFRNQRRYILRTAISVLVTVLIFAMITPLDQILIGALIYGLEQSSLNSAAFGIEWVKSTGSNSFLTYPLWEFFRSSWIMVSIVIGILLYWVISGRKLVERQRFVLLAIPLFLLTVLLIPRAAGRIDAGSFSRLGISSAWAVCLVLPIGLLTAFGQRAKALILVIVAMWGGVLNLAMDVSPVNLERLVRHPTITIDVSAFEIVDGAKIGLPNLDGGIPRPDHLQHLQRLHALLSILLEPNETYLDLADRNSRYFYLNYQPPMPGNALNLVHPHQQQRTISQMQRIATPLVVTAGIGSQFSSALRNPMLYHYVVDHYIPFKVDEFTFMIRPELRDRLKRLNSPQADEPSNLLVGDTDILRLALLDQFFGVRDVDGIPSSWGRSLRSLQQVIHPVQSLTAQPTLNDLKSLGDDRYQVTGNNPQLTFDISSLHLNGRDASLLGFDFTCKHRSKGALAVHWDSQALPDKSISSQQSTQETLINPAVNEDNMMRLHPRNGPQLMPLDAAPRWLLAKDLQTVTIEPIENVCHDFTLKNLRLYQRKDIANN